MDAYRATKDMAVPQYRQPDADVRRIWDHSVAKPVDSQMATLTTGGSCWTQNRL